MSKLSDKLLKAEISRRNLRKAIELRGDFPQQNAFIEDTSKFILASCSRRAGKTTALAYRFARTMAANPNSQCLYLALTRESAKEILWNALIEMNHNHSLGWNFKESNLEIKAPNGASLILYGADQTNFINRLRGRKYPGIAIDEAQSFGPHLEGLINDVLVPAMVDYDDAWLALTGTPGPVPLGYFYEAASNGKYGYSVHSWTLRENPTLRNVDRFLADLMERQAWDSQNPTYLREYCGRWVLDVQALWVQYKEERNDYDQLPPAKYTYIMGIDLGYKDADALAVLAYSDTDPNTYLVEELITPQQGITELVSQIEMLQKKYDIVKLIVDQGGLGLKVAEEIRRRHQIPVIGAEKQRKQETVKFLNDHLRQSRFKAKADSQFAQDSYLVQIDYDKTTPDRIVVKKNYHSDIIDAVLYAFKESPAYTYRKPIEKPKKGTQAFYDEEVSDMERQAEEYFTALENAEKGFDSDGF
jgi:Terminase large subunit, T4likevirus-type, N-terminal